MPVVSVVIPLYNKGPFIRRTLESVLAQTHRDLEVLVVDDGSTDQGPTVVEQCPDERVQLLRQANAGPGAARNRGIEASRAEWVAFLDADDWWQPQFLQAALQASRAFPEAVVVFTNYVLASTHKPVFACEAIQSQLLPDYFAFCLRNQGFGLCSSALMAKRQVLLEVGLFPANRCMGEDLDLWARLAWAGPVAFIAQPLAVYEDTTLGICSGRLFDGDIWSTYVHWQDKGGIPAHLQRSTLAFVCYLRLKTAAARLAAGRWTEAWRLASEVPLQRLASKGGMALVWSAALRCARFSRRGAEAVS
jgi:glycosyltransferase involved in cell wall biosynthesis